MEEPELGSLCRHLLAELEHRVVPSEAMEEDVVEPATVAVSGEKDASRFLDAAQVIPEPEPVVVELAASWDKVVDARGGAGFRHRERYRRGERGHE